MRLEQFIALKNDPQMEYFCAPGTIHRFEKRSSLSQIDSQEIRGAPVAVQQFIALKNYFRNGIFLCA